MIRLIVGDIITSVNSAMARLLIAIPPLLFNSATAPTSPSNRSLLISAYTSALLPATIKPIVGGWVVAINLVTATLVQRLVA